MRCRSAWTAEPSATSSVVLRKWSRTLLCTALFEFLYARFVLLTRTCSMGSEQHAYELGGDFAFFVLNINPLLISAGRILPIYLTNMFVFALRSGLFTGGRYLHLQSRFRCCSPLSKRPTTLSCHYHTSPWNRCRLKRSMHWNWVSNTRVRYP